MSIACHVAFNCTYWAEGEGLKVYLETHDERLALNIRKREVDVSNVAVGFVFRAVEDHTVQLAPDAVL